MKGEPKRVILARKPDKHSDVGRYKVTYWEIIAYFKKRATFKFESSIPDSDNMVNISQGDDDYRVESAEMRG